MSNKTVDGRIGYELKRVQHALRLKMDVGLRDAGLTTPQYAALSVLNDSPGLSGAALARRCFVTSQTMNQILANLESDGLVERRDHPEHGRVLQAFLTKRGTKSLVKAHRTVNEIEEQMLDGLGKKKRARFLDALLSCTKSLESRKPE
jgi:DNA-binding MarR family transcriptional regulator